MSFLSQRLVDKLAKFERSPQLGSDLKLSFDLLSFSSKYLLRNLFNHRVQANCLNVGLVFNGGIGDQIIEVQWGRVFVEELAKQGGQCYNVFMFENPEMGKTLLQGIDHVDQIADHNFIKNHKFDLLLSIEYFPRLWHVDYDAISKYAPFLVDKVKKAGELYGELAKFSMVCYHYQLMQYALAKGWSRYDLLGKCGLCEFDRNTVPFFFVDDNKVQTTLAKFGLLNSNFITIQSGMGALPADGLADGEDISQAKLRATKVLPKELAEDFLVKLKQEHPDLTIVQIGEPCGVEFKGVDICLLGQSSFSESLDLLYAAKVHIGNDSGLIHLRHAMRKQSVVLWGPTSKDFLGYSEDQNLQGNCSPCMWLTPEWSLNCPKGYRQALCMRTIQAQDVVEAVNRLL